MTIQKIGDLFSSDVSRRIEEVIKVDQDDVEIIRDELEEYVVTDSIRSRFVDILDTYMETPNKPHEGIAVWVSGFFGSGKSSFAKYLGLALENRDILGHGAAEILGQRTGDAKAKVLLRNITERIPTHAVIFDVSTDRGIRTGNQTLTEIMYRLFLQSLGYARDLDLSELEITLEEEGRLDDFQKKYHELFDKDWDREKGKIARAVQQASRVMHALEPATYTTADSWRESAMKRADITPGDLARRCLELMDRRCPGKSLVFVVDEVGQFVARDVQKMLDLQAVVQNLGRQGRGRLWTVVTSQEKLNELVGGLDGKRVELARLKDRFPLQVHLEPADISEVTSRRVLAKKGQTADPQLRKLFSEHRGRLTDNTRLSGEGKLPELNTDAFVDLYPLLPYQIDLIIDVVSGLRMAGGASKHVGGANRTIIKLAQQLLIHPDVQLATRSVGTLARLDQVYDLVAGNVASEVRGKIDEISKRVDHPLAQSVAKVICLLQYVERVHRTPENVAAALHPAVDADSRLPEVKQALEALLAAHMVRHGDDGLRIPTPAEDNWERQRAGLTPKQGDVNRLHSEATTGLWSPQPSHNFLDVKPFKAGLTLWGRPVVDGDVLFHLTLADAGKDHDERVEEARKRSQTETQAVFWVAATDDAVDRETVELYRSKEILARKERGAQTRDETRLVSEEKRRQGRHREELQRLVKQALLNGSIFFRGNDRSPGDDETDVGRTASRVLSQALPEVFDRFEDAAARAGKKDFDALMTTENLRGLPALFSDLRLVRDEGGNPVFNTESGPLAEIHARIENRTSYGEVASGRYITDEFGKEPFGWSFDVVRIFVISLMRAGKLDATSKGQVIDSAISLDARNTFGNNNLFRQASFRPRESLDFPKVVEAYEHFQSAFGQDIPELEQGVVAREIKRQVGLQEEPLQQMEMLLVSRRLPGAAMLRETIDQVRSIRGGSDENAVLAFNAAHREIKEASKRAADLELALTEPHLAGLERARQAVGPWWTFLQAEPEVDPALAEHAARLADLLAKETFFRDLPEIDEHARAVRDAYTRCFDEAMSERVSAYGQAIEQLHSTPGWETLAPEQQERLAAALEEGRNGTPRPDTPVAQIRAEVDACTGRLQRAVEETLRLIDGNRVVKVSAASYFAGGIETEEQLDEALKGLRQECEQLIGAGKKVLVQ